MVTQTYPPARLKAYRPQRADHPWLRRSGWLGRSILRLIHPMAAHSCRISGNGAVLIVPLPEDDATS